jgi:hypothetical protein
MVIALKLRGKNPDAATVDDFRAAYQDLRDSGLPIKYHQKVLDEQKKQQAVRGAKEIQTREAFDEDEAYAMPMNQLLKRAGGIR